jgi:hypothetical protein
MDVAMAVLEQEKKAYEAHRDELLAQAPGKFALVHGSEVVEIFDTKADAIASGYKRFGNIPFLVKEIVAVETPQNFVSNQLAV